MASKDICFTEHDEVIVNVPKLREIIRNAYEAGALDGREHPQLPITFMVETYLKKEEKKLRSTSGGK